MDSLLYLIAEHCISWTTLEYAKLLCGQLANWITSALMQSSAASASFWSVSDLCVSDTRAKTACVQSLDLLFCEVWFLLPGQWIS